MVRQGKSEVATGRGRLRFKKKWLSSCVALEQGPIPVLIGGATFIDKVTVFV